MTKSFRGVKCDAAITYGWNRIAYAVVRSLGLAGLKVAVGDSSSIAMGKQSKYCNYPFRYKSFYSDPKGFISDLKKELKQVSPRVYMPLHEESFVVARYIDEFKELNINIPLHDFKSLVKMHKKNKLAEVAVALGIPHPRTFTPKTLSELLPIWNELKGAGKVVVKTLNGNSAKGVFYASSYEELRVLYEMLISKVEREPERYPLVQEYVQGEGYGVSMLYNHGKMRASFTHKRLREKTFTGGTSTKRVSTRNRVLEEYSEKLLSSQSWHGLAMVEYKYDERSGKGWLIEVNPRFWGSIALAISSGVDFPLLLYKIAADGDVAPVVKYQEGVVQRWLLGDVMATIAAVKARRSLRPIGEFLEYNNEHFDDLFCDDLLPFISQGAYYGKKFISTMSMNPTHEALLDVDTL